MKKILFGTTALVAAGLVTSAHAAEKIKLGVSGYMWQEVGVADSRAGQTTVNLVSNTEVHFKGSTTLDNGLTIGADIQLEGNSQAADQIDESYAWIESKTWGKVILGTENGVGDLITTHAPGVGPMGIDGSNATYWFTNTGSAAPTSIDASDSGDNEKLTYISPKLGGMFQAGVSYTPSTDAEDGKGPSANTSLHNVVEGTLLLDTDIAGFGVRSSVSALHGSNQGANNRTVYSAGLNVSYAGFTVGGGWGRRINKGATTDGSAYNIGVSYATGPYGLSLGYHNGTANGSNGDNGSEDGFTATELAMSYKISDGVDFKSGVSYVQFEQDVETNPLNGGGNGYENDGWIWINGIYLSF
ncbi:porin [Alphaproteobacteria bacterium HT1-32]|nr:porin [Alphaproteobacteria bacterium HT1-32]